MAPVDMAILKTNRLILFLALAFFVGSTSQIMAQDAPVSTSSSSTVSGQVIATNDNAKLIGAHAALLYPWDDVYKSAITDSEGKFQFTDVEQGGYKLKISYLGFKDWVQEITINSGDANVGQVKMIPGGIALDEIEVKGKIPIAVVEGDTVSYNADAFKTLPDANAEDLISKMPGIIIENGQVQAQGENIQEVLVDGKPFFGNDPNAALKNLPAEVINKIQVYDQESEQAQFSGVSDGNTTKTINIITRPEMRNGQFGKIYAGLGAEGRYNAGGNSNIFDAQRRISIIGHTNNVNQQNFSSEDLLNALGSSGRRSFGGGGRGRGGGGRGSGGAGGRGGRGGGSSDFLVNQQGGIAQTHAIGLNYSDEWGEKISLTGSYFFNTSDREAETISAIEYFQRPGQNEFYDEVDNSQTNNLNHRANLRMTYKVSDKTSFLWRPSVTYQGNDGTSSLLGETANDSELLNNTLTDFQSDLSALRFTNNLLWRQRFDKDGRTISLSLRNTLNNQDGLSLLQSTNDIFTGQMILDSLNQTADFDNQGWTHSANVNYTEPIGQSLDLQMTYQFSHQTDDSDKLTETFNPDSEAYDLIEEPLSSVFENRTVSHQFGTGITFSKSRDLIISARANIELTNQQSDETYPTPQMVNRDFVRFVPFAMMRWNASESTNFRLFYRSSTQTPSITQLQNVVDNSNPLQLSVGNPALDQSVSHGIYLRFRNTNLDRATMLYGFVSASFVDDYIGTQTFTARSNDPIFETLNLSRGVQLSRPANVSGYQNYRAFLTYGMPLTFIKTNFNLDLAGSYQRTPGLINDQQNVSSNKNITTGISFSSNISEKVDFTIGTRVGFNDVTNSVQSDLNDQYVTQSSRLKIGTIFPGGIVFRTEMNHQSYNGLSQGFDDQYVLWSAGIGKKIFKNQLGEITITAVDIFNANQQIQRNVGETYIEDIRTQVLQRYFLVSLTYNFRNWKSKKSEE